MAHLPANASPKPLSAAAVGRVAAEQVPRWLWRVLHPMQRLPFDEGQPAQLAPHRVATDDGWTLPLYELAAAPGGAGEPVLLLHTLGLGPLSLAYGRHSLARSLARRGRRVFLAGTRLDGEAIAPAGGEVTFEGSVDEDVPALVAKILALSGARRLLLLGHGLGGLQVLGHVARAGDDHLAGVAVLGAPVAFEAPGHELRRWLQAGAWLPASWKAPARLLARVAGAVVDPDPVGLRRAANPVGPTLRGVLRHHAEDIPVGLLHQMRAWLRAGRLVQGDDLRDYGRLLARASCPLWMGMGVSDAWCPPEWALPLRSLWGGERVKLWWWGDEDGHLDVVLRPDGVHDLAVALHAWATPLLQDCWHEKARTA